MGGGTFDDSIYQSQTTARKAAGKSDFDYTERATEVHKSLDPKRIKDKVNGVLESCDSTEHPESTAIIVTFDVTGSNYDNAVEAQKKLPDLMKKLTAVVANPQIAIWTNDDTKCCGNNAIQMSEFESDNRIDESIRNLWLTGQGGGNGGESYDLLIYAAARKTKCDCFDKRGKRGYMFLYADENFWHQVSKEDVRLVFGDSSEVDIPITEMVAEAQQKWNIFVVTPRNVYLQAREMYEELFGKDHVIRSESPDMLCDTIAGVVAGEEERLKETAQLAAAEASSDFTTRVV